jgi:TonB family protein
MRTLVICTLLILSAPAFASGQTAGSPARKELEAGKRLFDEGDFAGAQRHFERALELAPANRNIPLLIARAIHKQYQPGVDTIENKTKGMEAVAAYQRVPWASEAYHAAIQLLTDMGDDELAHRFQLGLAHSAFLPPEEHLVALNALAAQELECARLVDVAVGPGEEVALADIGEAYICVEDGLKYVERALSINPGDINPGDETALERQASLRREQEKLERMGKELMARLERAARPPARPGGEARRSEESEGKTLPAASSGDGDTPDLRQIAFRSGVDLRGMAISKPPPDYPPEARAAGVSGLVEVSVNVDEAGRVVTARALSGHYLLRPAAVAAAKRARFSPRAAGYTTTGILTHTIRYYFALK